MALNGLIRTRTGLFFAFMTFLEELHQKIPNTKTWEDYNNHVYNTVTQQIVEIKENTYMHNLLSHAHL